MTGPTPPSSRAGERGSALVIAVLVTVILALLGISFLLMGETENRIAQNEKLAGQALYVAESAARAVKRWFDDPTGALHVPTAAVVELQLRKIVDESDPYGSPPIDANGVSEPWYKQGIDLNGDGQDDLFDRPYRGGKFHALMGTEDGPDLRIDIDDAAAVAFLDGLSQTLMGDFPARGLDGNGLLSRVKRIDVYAPPYIDVSGTWSRFGMGTVKVIAQIYRKSGGSEQVIAEREVRAVLSEAPYSGPYGPLHSCGDLTLTGPLTAYWGVITAEGEMNLSDDAVAHIPTSLPREQPSLPNIDPMWNASPSSVIDTIKSNLDGLTPASPWDPWFRTISAGPIVSAAVGGGVQPFPPATSPYTCCGRSNLIQDLAFTICPTYDYDLWKLIAGSGGSDVRYFRWQVGTSPPLFQENGVGTAASFYALTNNAEGVFFFDTTDALAPHDDDGDGTFENLTPPIEVKNVSWHFRGLLYLNAESFQVDNVVGAVTTFNRPGEPFQDADLDGEYDAGENWINLDYPGTLGGLVSIDQDLPLGASVRDASGPDLTGVRAAFEGILFTQGEFEATGSGVFYGSVIANLGVTQAVTGGGSLSPSLYWDERIKADWPPVGWPLPRVVITGWDTDR